MAQVPRRAGAGPADPGALGRPLRLRLGLGSVLIHAGWDHKCTIRPEPTLLMSEHWVLVVATPASCYSELRLEAARGG